MKRIFPLLLAFCALSPVFAAENNCLQYRGEYDIEFSGGISGPGKLSIRPSKNQIGLFDLNTRLLSPDGASIVAEVDGIGGCRDGVFRMRLGADRNSHPTYKVLGGSTVGVLQPDVIDKQFGYWELLMLNKDTAERISVSGLWIVKKKTL